MSNIIPNVWTAGAVAVDTSSVDVQKTIRYTCTRTSNAERGTPPHY